MKRLEDLIPGLQDWNNGDGVDVETYIGCLGNANLALGYTTIFWPGFVVFEDYVLREGFSVGSLRAWEKQCPPDRKSIEAMMNHIHLADLHHAGDEALTADKATYLGHVLKEIYEAKLALLSPNRPCEVSLCIPEDLEHLWEYELTFWQKP